jgi:hypothetical protein
MDITLNCNLMKTLCDNNSLNCIPKFEHLSVFIGVELVA